MPFIVSWPGTVQPGLSDALISQVDILASLAALVDIDIPGGRAADSHNVLDALLGKSESGRDYLIQQGVKLEGIRKGPWKYLPEGEVTNRGKVGIFFKDVITAPGALFYLPEDSAEQNNVAQLYPAKVKELNELLERELGDTTGRDSSDDQLGGAVQR